MQLSGRAEAQAFIKGLGCEIIVPGEEGKLGSALALTELDGGFQQGAACPLPAPGGIHKKFRDLPRRLLVAEGTLEQTAAKAD